MLVKHRQICSCDDPHLEMTEKKLTESRSNVQLDDERICSFHEYTFFAEHIRCNLFERGLYIIKKLLC